MTDRSWSRLTLIPAIVGLVSTSVIFGYASSDLRPSRSDNAEVSVIQTARTGGDDLSRESVPEVTPRDRDRAQDPLNNYKATLALLKKNYYGAPLDSKKKQQLTYEAI